MNLQASVASAALASLLVLGADASAPPAASSERSSSSAPSDASPAAPNTPPGSGQRSPRGEGERQDGRPDGPRGGNMPLTPELVERIIAVAKDVSPEFGRQLEERRNASPEELTQTMRQNARRLIGLAYLKERDPTLYATRVEDLRLQLELQSLGERYVAAQTAGDAPKMQSLAVEIEAKVRRQVDLDLKARAEELRQIAQKLADMKEQLSQELKQTEQRVSEHIETIKSGQPIRPRSFPGDGEGRGRPRDGEGRPRDGRPDRAAPPDGAKPKSDTPPSN